MNKEKKILEYCFYMYYKAKAQQSKLNLVLKSKSNTEQIVIHNIANYFDNLVSDVILASIHCLLK